MPTALDQRNYRVNDEHYALVPKADIPRSTFRRRHEHKTTAPSGYLIPILCDEVLPGDVHTGRVTVFGRLSTLLFPLMDTASIETQFFFVPARILWPNWKKFMGEQSNPADSISYLIPTVPTVGKVTAFSTPDLTYMLLDYFGVPVANYPGNTVNINSLPLRAYNLIWNEWYRDENLQNSATVPNGDGPDTLSFFFMLRRNKKHDYFTSCLPSPQKGNPVNLPLSGTAPVLGIGTSSQVFSASPPTPVYETQGGTTWGFGVQATTGSTIWVKGSAAASGLPLVYADLSQATATTINALRLAVQTQKLLERDARGGTRYTESLQSHWGVHPQDSRLQRPEYIGGGVTDIQTAAIAQTSGAGVTGQTTQFGSLSGQATAGGQHGYTCVAQEHGYIIGLMSLMTTSLYQESLHRMWTRSTRYDFAWPEFAALGEQAVRNDEIYAQGTAADALTFGYQERYAEYRWAISRVSGLFRTKNTGSISQWHLAQNNAALPTLGTTFIQETAPFSRVLAAGASADYWQYIADILFDVKCTRALPAYGVPGSLLGTF
jgi:hypothetical protein